MGHWVDTHCHLQLTADDPAELLARATDVAHIVVPGVDLVSTRRAVELVDQDPDRLRYSSGLHPHDAAKWPEQRDGLIELMKHAAAVGETGLDFYRNLSPPDLQRGSFADHLELAAELGKPIIVHCRDAFADVYDMLSTADLGPAAVLHCWTGGPKWSKRFAELGCTFSFAGPVAFETGDTVRRGAAVIDPDRVMVETDTPYLSPPPHRHENNEPARVAIVGQALADVWGMEVAEVARRTSAKAAEVFSL